jgi:hypothetical protein
MRDRFALRIKQTVEALLHFAQHRAGFFFCSRASACERSTSVLLQGYTCDKTFLAGGNEASLTTGVPAACAIAVRLLKPSNSQNVDFI